MTGSQPGSLLSRQFISLNIVFLFAVSVMALFFQFQHYLQALSIPPVWFGFLMGADSLASFVFQPVLAVRLNGRNGRRWIAISLVGMAVSLFLYNWAFNVAALVAVRIIHGAAFVCLISAIMAMMTVYVPQEKSGRAFGLISIVRLLPYAIIPPLIPLAGEKPSDFRHVLVLGGLVMLFSIFAAFFLTPARPEATPGSGDIRTLHGRDLLMNLRNRKIVTLFGAQFLLYSSYTIIFYFLREYAHGQGIENPGLFFTIATLAMIGVRVAGSAFFDRFNKTVVTGLSMAGLAACYFALGALCRPGTFYVLALLTGLGWGIAVPVITALVFDTSEPRLRSMNLNLSLLVMQGGFFAGPCAGGAIISFGGYGMLLHFTTFITLVAAGLMWTLVRGRRI